MLHSFQLVFSLCVSYVIKYTRHQSLSICSTQWGSVWWLRTTACKFIATHWQWETCYLVRTNDTTLNQAWSLLKQTAQVAWKVVLTAAIYRHDLWTIVCLAHDQLTVSTRREGSGDLGPLCINVWSTIILVVWEGKGLASKIRQALTTLLYGAKFSWVLIS